MKRTLLIRAGAFGAGLLLVCGMLLPHAVQVTSAGWPDSQAGTILTTARELPAVRKLSCKTESGGLLGVDKAHISWVLDGGLPPGAKYEVVIQKKDGASAALPLQVETQVTMVSSLLNSLLGLVLDLLSPPAEYLVTVSVVYPDTLWRSPPSPVQSTKYSGALLGLLGGFKC